MKGKEAATRKRVEGMKRWRDAARKERRGDEGIWWWEEMRGCCKKEEQGDEGIWGWEEIKWCCKRKEGDIGEAYAAGSNQSKEVEGETSGGKGEEGKESGGMGEPLPEKRRKEWRNKWRWIWRNICVMKVRREGWWKKMDLWGRGSSGGERAVGW